ncbi:hypothetical protein GGI25_004527 [Coemansia spiralis]|uniref:Uncharacterized protein n=2 Tax=Coemansia TaxID=4863 RepID=A0A9W8G091_9FUNG|nr:hypothetical protein BX070DRAFT_229635 [Coemansia spiralis]KAJ1990172.1 hypothetical protein EDC05_004228 [Coemansia umbellata]KAJ2620697.1 hypothetical protein GGI26_004775 [Coemansia sp. RSA 1358]KAJ2673960.1 hypothetical protein GGI25_004527 [Coemansia spiralis]
MNRFRIYDVVQKSLSTALFVTTVLGSGFIGINVYNNWVEKQKLQAELSYKRMIKDDPENKRQLAKD